MSLSLFLPTTATPQKLPVLFFLSGLTCTPANCTEKGFLQHAAARNNIAIVYPDTSPRGASIAGEDDAWDFGTGAGFYLDATAAPWDKNYNMYSYITSELPKALWEQYGDTLDKERVSIMGHSMGGHGALVATLKNPGMYKSVSALAPIANPGKCPWGEKAFSGYLKEKEEWAAWDATELLQKSGKEGKGKEFKALVDVGTEDGFWKQGQLRTEELERVVGEVGADVEVRYQKVCWKPRRTDGRANGG